MEPSLQVVYVNWFTAGELARSLRSLRDDGRDIALEVTIVDNSCDPREAARLDALCDRDTRVIRSETNVGFASACNRGARAGRAPDVLFLNPGTSPASSSLVLAAARSAT